MSFGLGYLKCSLYNFQAVSLPGCTIFKIKKIRMLALHVKKLLTIFIEREITHCLSGTQSEGCQCCHLLIVAGSKQASCEMISAQQACWGLLGVSVPWELLVLEDFWLPRKKKKESIIRNYFCYRYSYQQCYIL